MKSKILLVNFDYSDKKKIQDKFDIEVDIGYVSDCTKYTYGGDEEYMIYFYAPQSIYEYKVCFVYLTKNPIGEYLFKEKAEKIVLGNKNKKISESREIYNFIKYWFEKGIMVIFLGDSSFESLSILGIPNIDLYPAKQGDKTVRFKLFVDNELRQLFKKYSSHVKMPPYKYINFSLPSRLEEDYKIFSIYENLNDECLGCYFTNRSFLDGKDDPRFFILPTFENNLEVVIELLKIFAKIYPNFLPEVYEADWVNSEKYYPNEVYYFDREIENLKKSFQDKIIQLQEAKESAKKKYEFLRNILITSGDELKDAIIRVLSDIWKLSVKDVDKERKTEFKEDILIEEDGKCILAEIKGTRDKNPTSKYITQLLVHIKKSDYEKAEGMLILNHDLLTDPDDRNDAYLNEEDEKILQEIIFVDTRVLFRLSLAIIDYGMPLEEAKEILFKKGRVKFDLDEYIKNKKN